MHLSNLHAVRHEPLLVLLLPTHQGLCSAASLVTRGLVFYTFWPMLKVATSCPVRFGEPEPLQGVIFGLMHEGSARAGTLVIGHCFS